MAIFAFEDFELDTGRFELRRGGVAIPVEPLVFDLLVTLAGRPGEVISRDDLIDAVWDGRIVSDSTISTAIKNARKALGDTGAEQRHIRTVRGRGIQFVATPSERATPAAVASAVATQPALFLRPFDATESASGLARGVEARLRTALSRVPLLRIVAPFAGAEPDPRQLRAQSGATLVLAVMLQRGSNMLSADVTLSETRDGFQIWAQRFEVADGDGAEDALLRAMVARVEPNLVQAMMAELKAAGRPAHARSLLLEAMGLLALKGWHRATFLESADLVERAIGAQPDLALAHAYHALILALGHRFGLLRGSPGVADRAALFADSALALESQDSMVLGLAGCALADIGDVDRALPVLRKAVDVDPDNGHAKTALGAALLTRREFDPAVALLREGIRISPADNRLAVWGAALALGELARGDLDAALAAAEEACASDDRMYVPRVALAAIRLARGEADQAAGVVKDCLRTKPDLNEVEVTSLVGRRLGNAVWRMCSERRKKDRS